MRSGQFISFCLLVLPLAAAAQVLPTVSAASGPIEVLIRNEAKNVWLEPTTLIAVLGALGGLAAVLVQRYWHRQDDELSRNRAAEDRRRSDERFDNERQVARETAERERFLSHVLESLRWFEGKTQRRSIGISVVEGNWSRFPELQSTWIAVLANQAVYLLAKSSEDDAQHEVANLYRIMGLLSRVEVAFSQVQRESLSAALQKNAKGQGLRGVTDIDRAKWGARINAV